MKDKIENILTEAMDAIKTVNSANPLNDLRIRLLGKKGSLTALMKSIGAAPPEERAEIGKMVNTARDQIETELDDALLKIKEKEKEEKLKSERADVTLPGHKLPLGSMHPLTIVYHEIRDIFLRMGFDVYEGPEVESDKYNFEMLNIPKNHPARDMQDTFYISDDVVLRTHTSPVQIRTMLKKKPPIRMICPGRVYRCDDVDATHSPVFNQIEGLVVDKNVTLANLKGTINAFLKEFYGEHTVTKFRPGYFPFTEPSAEVDATCSLCNGAGCPACKGAGMIEVLGCGMVNPVVLSNCGIDPEEYSGFAFGLGLDRLTNIKYGITDIRLLYENDVRFLNQFK
jgi:phenylalanyl-tRNA synthetase alpha chain